MIILEKAPIIVKIVKDSGLDNCHAETSIGTFTATRRKYLDVNGNPIMYVDAPKFVGKIVGFKKVRNQERYYTQSYNFEEDLKNFISEYAKILRES